MIICKICKKEIKDMLTLSQHIKNHGYNNVLEYYINCENFKIPKCEFCEKEAKLIKGIKFRKTCGCNSCVTKTRIKKISDETKIKISNSLKISHKNGKHPGWSFINNDINRRSYPEKWFIKNVLKKYEFYSKYIIKEKLPYSKYFLDFALLDMKIDIEIDGQQHFRTDDAIIHDIERDRFMLSNDWRIYRIAWLEIVKNPNETILNFLNWLDNEEKYRKYDVTILLNDLKKKDLKYGNRTKYNEFITKIYLEKNTPKIKIVEKSNIDFTKFGWVKDVSILLGIKSQKVNKWMLKYMPDFYDKKCFKRNSSKITKYQDSSNGSERWHHKPKVVGSNPILDTK